MPQEVQLAIGRLFRMLSRPEKPGDVKAFYACRDIVMNAADASGRVYEDKRQNWARDRRKGAQGDC